MNRKTYILVAAALLTISTLSSCSDDFLDRNPKLAVTENDIFSSEELIDATMAGVYTRFKNSSFAGRMPLPSAMHCQ